MISPNETRYVVDSDDNGLPVVLTVRVVRPMENGVYEVDRAPFISIVGEDLLSSEEDALSIAIHRVRKLIALANKRMGELGTRRTALLREEVDREAPDPEQR
jgi:hypothetical protein